MTLSIPLTRQQAQGQWERFLPRVPRYGVERNHVLRGHGNVSRLSAAVRYRTLLEEEIVRETLATHSIEGALKWLQEVYWRGYWKGWLERRPQVWDGWRAVVRGGRGRWSDAIWKRAEAVQEGQSGVGCMDALARELIETGYLHNHARMWWASFWVHVEGLPWELGADFFFRHLLDADPASNTLSWRWVAGLQTPGKTYLVRLSNLEKYGVEYVRADPGGSERLADSVVKARVVRESVDLVPRTLPQYPEAMVGDAERLGIWLHPDDLTPEVGPLEGVHPMAIAACHAEPVYRGVYGLSERRIESLRTVLWDAIQRAGCHFGCAAELVETGDSVGALVAWAKQHRLDQVVALAPMVGPISDLLPRLRGSLAEQGIRLTLLRRPSDASLFSLATAGFFPFWEKVRRELDGRLGHKRGCS